jgi:predicted metal-dependent hydrolase
MQKEIEIGKQKIYYTLRQSKRARRARLTINCEGNLVVTLPHFFFFGESAAEKFIQEKAAWVLRNLNYFKKNQGQYLFRSSRREFLKYKEIARAKAREKINYFNAFYQFSLGKISIRNQKTRWGSCSRQGNLNFNYKIALLPEKLADYIIVHELCHLKEFNHSANFWNLVSKTVPDYKILRKKIKGK